jgi:LysW-gamma-L-alpha-aminoadipyl-6-phosphate/LysW-L-glutamyl-5-phosphate reductase
MLKVSIVGASGYVGGEALRILLGHPNVEVQQVTSEAHAGKFVHTVHPNLRKRTMLKFSSIEDLQPCDFLFLALPHKQSSTRIKDLMQAAPKMCDLAADFRLNNEAGYQRFYDMDQHPAADLLPKFIYGIPELHREAIQGADLVTGAGCLATASILSVYPIVKAGLLTDPTIVLEGKTGSSAAGNKANMSTHHPERSGVMRSYAPTGHRHTAEIVQELTMDGKEPDIRFSATSIEAVRGILVTAHCSVDSSLTDKDLWKAYRAAYGKEPFIRIVKERTGLYRYPEPKILSGSNYCDVGFQKAPDRPWVVAMAAIDNLMKGAAGNGVQAMNLMCGFEETAGLEFSGMHP